MSAPGAGAGAGASAPPTCYRHPDRETYIRCSRCDRPICPECMTPAPVGFQCPACVAEGSSSIQRPRSVLGAELTEGKPGAGELVTRVLVGVQLAGFLLVQVLGPSVVRTLGLVGSGFDGSGLVGVAHGQLWRLVTASLLPSGAGAALSAGLLSLLFGLLFTYLLGRTLEPDLGRWRFLALWVCSAVAGNAAALLVLPSATLTYGGTGAAFGLLTATLVVGRRLRRQVSGLVVLAGIWVALSVLRLASDWTAPIGGALAGASLAAVAAYAPRERRTPLFWAAAGVLLLGSVVVAGAAA